MRDASRVQIERDIARCRVILSIAAPFAVYLDPTEPTLFLQLTGGLFLIDPYALAVLLLHLIYSLTVYVIVSRPAVSLNRVAVLSMTADVLFGAAVALVTEGTNSPYYIFFLFAVLAAGLRGTLRTALVVTAASLALYLTLILVSRPEGLGFYITRAVYLAITGYLVGSLGRQRRILETGFHGLARSLHDGYAQALAGVNLRVETCRELLRRGQRRRGVRGADRAPGGRDAGVRRAARLRALARSVSRRPLARRRRAPRGSPCGPSSTARSPVVEHALQICSRERATWRGTRGARGRASRQRRRPTSVVIRIDDDGVGFSEATSRRGRSRRAPPSSAARCGSAATAAAGGHVVVELPREHERWPTTHTDRDRRRPRALPPGAQVDARGCSPTSSSSADVERVATCSTLRRRPLRRPAARPADGPQRARRHRGPEPPRPGRRRHRQRAAERGARGAARRRARRRLQALRDRDADGRRSRAVMDGHVWMPPALQAEVAARMLRARERRAVARASARSCASSPSGCATPRWRSASPSPRPR